MNLNKIFTYVTGCEKRYIRTYYYVCPIKMVSLPGFMRYAFTEKETHTFLQCDSWDSSDSSFSRCTMHPWWHILQVRNWILSVCTNGTWQWPKARPRTRPHPVRRRYLFNLKVLLRAMFSSVRFILAMIISRIFNVGEASDVRNTGHC